VSNRAILKFDRTI